MKKIIWIVMLAAILALNVHAQDRVKERDLKGEWKMVFDFDEDDLAEEIEDESIFGWMFSDAVSGFVVNILEDIDIRMEFMDNGRLRMTVIAFGDKEVEYLKWSINRDGELIISESGKYDDDVWMMEEGKLVAYEKDSRGNFERQQVYLLRQ